MSFPRNDTPSPCLALQGLAVSFGGQRVLDALDWSLPAGRVVGLLGRNGAGKTTLIETLLGLREPDAGKRACSASPRWRWATMRVPASATCRSAPTCSNG